MCAHTPPTQSRRSVKQHESGQLAIVHSQAPTHLSNAVRMAAQRRGTTHVHGMHMQQGRNKRDELEMNWG